MDWMEPDLPRPRPRPAAGADGAAPGPSGGSDAREDTACSSGGNAGISPDGTMPGGISGPWSLTLARRAIDPFSATLLGDMSSVAAEEEDEDEEEEDAEKLLRRCTSLPLPVLADPWEGRRAGGEAVRPVPAVLVVAARPAPPVPVAERRPLRPGSGGAAGFGRFIVSISPASLSAPCLRDAVTVASHSDSAVAARRAGECCNAKQRLSSCPAGLSR